MFEGGKGGRVPVNFDLAVEMEGMGAVCSSGRVDMTRRGIFFKFILTASISCHRSVVEAGTEEEVPDEFESSRRDSDLWVCRGYGGVVAVVIRSGR